ncbi:hypothetical protein P0X99_002611 [Serratia marcescens]
MKKYNFLFFTVLFGSGMASANVINWPVLEDMKIHSCANSSCGSSVVYYTSGAVNLTPVTPVIPMPTGTDTRVRAYGVHCSTGDGTASSPFRSCKWSPGSTHAPSMLSPSACTVVTGTWNLTNPSACGVRGGTFGNHSGARPGAECVLFGISGSSNASIQTPWGVLTAQQVANAGNLYCVKPLPPSVKCEIALENGGVIDHGTVEPNSNTKRYLKMDIDCGNASHFEFVGGTDLVLGSGVQTKLSLEYIGGSVVIGSTMHTVNANPGYYSGSRVIVVTPL